MVDGMEAVGRSFDHAVAAFVEDVVEQDDELLEHFVGLRADDGKPAGDEGRDAFGGNLLDRVFVRLCRSLQRFGLGFYWLLRFGGRGNLRLWRFDACAYWLLLLGDGGQLRLWPDW